VTSTVEALVQPHVRQLLDEVRDLLNRLGTNVRALFGDALPVDDLETLARSIGDAGERPLRLEDLVDRLGEAGRRRAVDTRRLNRLIELMRSLRDLEWVLAEGPTGIGRARVAMATAGDALEPSCRFPRNPFTFPVAVHWSDDGADFAAGLCRGLLRHALDNLRLVRRARLEAADRYDPRKHDEEIASLDWPELTDEEWSAVPPLLLVGDDSALTGRSAARLGTLLDSELPVKVLILDRRAGGAAGDSDPAAAVGDGLFALAHRNAFVLRTSTANPGHFLEGLAAALRSRRPALVHVYAPSPGRDGFRPDAGRIQSRLATASRAFPCLRYDPDAEGVFGLRLSLDGNPEPEADFARLELEYRDDGESKALALPVTFAHWALGQGRFAAHFTRIAPAVGGMPLDEWLGATPDLRAGKPAFIRSVDPQGDLVHYRVSDAMANAASRAHEAWRVLQELSGLVTPFTAALRKRLEAELAEAHEGEIARVKAEYEERLGRLAEEHHAETAARLRERLLQLSGFGRRPEDTTNGA
jgi:pyruvate-ferredoxin/flavodoxin oxidoreductase